MTYIVLLSTDAIQELDAAYEWLVEQTPLHGPRWYNDLLDAILSLETLPARCPLATETDDAQDETRQLLFGDKQHAYRILFFIRDNTVNITHIRHAARRQF